MRSTLWVSPVPETFKLIAVKFHVDLVSPGVDQLQVCPESRTVIRQDYPSLDSGVICKRRCSGVHREILGDISDVDQEQDWNCNVLIVLIL